MAAGPVPERAHPVRRVVAQLNAGLDEAAGVPLWSLTAAESGDLLRQVHAAEAKLAALKLELVAHADSEPVDLPAQEATTSMVAWLRRHTQIPPGQASGSSSSLTV